MPIYFKGHRINDVVVGTASGSTAGATLTNAADLRAGLIAYGRYGQVTGTMQDLAATTYTPGTSNQVISSGKYIAGAQTILGDSNLVAGNIKSGVTIFGITGSYGGAGAILQTKTASPTTSEQVIEADSGYDGLESVTIEAIQTETKTATPSETAQTITPTSGKYLASVSVGAIASNYVGSGIARKSSTDLTASGATITAPAGYYATAASKSVASGSVAGPSSLSASGASVTTGSNTITLTKSSVTTTPTVSAGYVSGATASTATVALTASVTTKGAATITPGTTAKEIAAGTYLTGKQTISGDANLVAGNIKSGTSIFGVTGSYSGSAIENQDKTVTPSTTQQTVTADAGYTGLGTVTVNAIQTETKTATPSTSLQNIEPTSGKYLTRVTIDAMPTMTLPTAAATSATSGFTSKATIGRSTSDQYINIPTGYNSAGAYYKISGVANGSAGTPIATKGTVSNNSISVTPSVTNTTGYITGGTKSGTAVTVSASELVSGTKTITANDTGIDVTNYASVDVAVPVGDTINNQNKTVTPTKSQQSITADSGYTGLGTVTVNAIPAAYITTSDANAVAANLLLNKTAYVNGSKITGTMANNGATGGTITSQNGTYTIPAGYTSGGTVTATLPTGSTTAANISGAAFEETTGDYGFRTSVQIQPGYYASATTVTKDFSSMLPAPDTEGTAAQVLAGYDLYDHDGKLISGTMTNNSIGTINLDQTTTSYTIPAGYHDGTGKVQHTTVNIPDPTITVSSSGLITASGSWTRGFTTDNSYSNTKQLSTMSSQTVLPEETAKTLAVSGYYMLGNVTVSAIPSDYVGSGITSRSSSDLTVSGATVTAPAGYYENAASTSVATMTLPTATVSYTVGGQKAAITPSTSVQYLNIPAGYNSSSMYYRIQAMSSGSVTAPTSISGTSAVVSTGTNTLTLSKTVSVTPNVTTAGYISSGTAGNSSVSLTANVTTKAAATITPGTTNQTIAADTYLTGTQTISGDADLVAGNIKTGVDIFGITGTYTSDATATAADIVDGETAYVNGSKVTGTLVVQTYYTGRTAPAASLGNNGDIYLQS